jgi:hypothetical protein
MIKGMEAFAPTRRVEEYAEGVIVYVKPPKLPGKPLPEVSVHLTRDQFKRYAKWQSGVLMIQEALPELSPSEREKLMSGLGDDDFARMAGGEDDD